MVYEIKGIRGLRLLKSVVEADKTIDAMKLFVDEWEDKSSLPEVEIESIRILSTEKVIRGLRR